MSKLFPDSSLECDSFQGSLRRFLTNIDVKSLVALVPILTLAYAFLQDRLVSHHSDLRVIALECAPETITVAAMNLGDRHGLLKEANVQLVTDGTVQKNTLLRAEYNLQPYILVEPSKTTVLTLKPMLGNQVGC